MISHVVMWKLKNISEGDEVVRRLKNLEGKIPGLISIEAGADTNRSDAAWDVVLISTHESKDALDSYQVHPDHMEVKKFIGSVAAERAVVDFSGS
ncbi:Dabb family protein [Spirochaeta isovalerica]|uniref:D-tyrosyl-tRNA(Tyr) deacylase n=1 Tax=Spirochaeta isovalerica TaxID=150 RepID=A0A841RBF6_9SPIO|nr:Dabb family protein [Spirochaeta isovalerica]MBB6481036.1 D-tyrosyl-tRNA(Tyr) deacylase [Spirochaeta isovalerica]